MKKKFLRFWDALVGWVWFSVFILVVFAMLSLLFLADTFRWSL